MAQGSAIRGTRIGSGPQRPTERTEPAPRREIRYWCANGHNFPIQFAADAAVPDTWDCPRCGSPAGQNEQDPPGRRPGDRYKSHLAYVKERRSEADAAAILDEALAKLRQRRGSA